MGHLSINVTTIIPTILETIVIFGQ